MKTKQNLSKLLNDYRPIPGKKYYRKMESAPWAGSPKSGKVRLPRLGRFAWQAAAAALLVITVLGLGIPGVRASLSAWLGLSVAPTNRMPVSAVTLVQLTPEATVETPKPASSSPMGTPTAPGEAAPPQQESSTVTPDETGTPLAQVDWDILTPSQLPSGYQYESSYYDTNHRMLVLTYLATRPLPGASDPSLTSSQTITLLEALSNDFIPLQVAPEAAVTDVSIEGQPAVFTTGAWDTEFVKDEANPNGGQMVSTWRNDLPVKNLFWQVGKVYLALVTADETVSQEDLIGMAASLKGR